MTIENVFLQMRILLRARNSLLSSTTSFASHKRRRPSTLKVVEVEQKNLASEEPLRIPSTSGTSTDFVDFVLDKYRSELQQLSVSLKKHVEADRAGLQKVRLFFEWFVSLIWCMIIFDSFLMCLRFRAFVFTNERESEVACCLYWSS